MSAPTPEQLRQLIAAGVDVPVITVNAQGDKLTAILLGGRMVVVKLESCGEPAPGVTPGDGAENSKAEHSYAESGETTANSLTRAGVASKKTRSATRKRRK